MTRYSEGYGTEVKCGLVCVCYFKIGLCECVCVESDQQVCEDFIFVLPFILAGSCGFVSLFQGSSMRGIHD